MTSLRGQTPGKREMQIRVVGAERGAALVRIALWAIVYVSVLSNPHRQGWHDVLAGTIVVKAHT